MMRIVYEKGIVDILVLEKSAYRLAEHITVDFSFSDCQILCDISPSLNSEWSIEQCVESFKKEVLDYQLRAKLQAKTEIIRNLILATAFSKTELV
jgi:His-Xaa-Ser system protein HxsD